LCDDFPEVKTMSVATTRPLLEATEHRLTAADLAAMPTDLPSGPVKYELDDGRIVSMSPPGNQHGHIQIILGAALYDQGEKAGHGIAYGEVGVILWRNPDRVVGIDNGFVKTASLPIPTSPEGYLERAPDLMVEIRSKNDKRAYIDRKVSDYLQVGAKVVVVVDPRAETVTIHRASAPPHVLTAHDTLTFDDIIPGFRLACFSQPPGHLRGRSSAKDSTSMIAPATI
jgi:Uma2 family endonuclease